LNLLPQRFKADLYKSLSLSSRYAKSFKKLGQRDSFSLKPAKHRRLSIHPNLNRHRLRINSDIVKEEKLLDPIAVIRSNFLPISETFIYSEIQEMKSYEPYIFCLKRKNKSLFPHKKVIIDPHYRQLNLKLGNRFFKLIHARFGTAGIRMIPLKEKWQIPLITSFHGCDSPGTARMRKYKNSLLRLFSIGECFTVPCLAMKQELIKHGCPVSKIAVQYSGINLDQFSYKERFYPIDGQVRIVHVGRLVEKKGAEILIKAFQRIHQVFPQAQLRLIGEGVLLKKLKQLSKRLKLEKYVEFMGALPHYEIAKQLEQAHIFCLPSLKDRTGNSEGIPNAIKEAMACGLPVVSTFHSGIPELIKDGKCGHLVKENDVNGLANKLIDLIRQPETWRQLGLNARVKIEADFNRQTQTDKLERLFDQVIKAHEKKVK
jgi:colanic acid/amylovoran biosynthesis glycosyltransferase